MRILIYGAGVLGSLYAARLAAARDEVTVLARGRRLTELGALADATPVPTPAIDRLAAYLDPAVPPLAEGSADLPLHWAGAGALFSGLLGAGLLPHRRWAGLLGGALAGLLLSRRLSASRRMPLARRWQRALARRRGPEVAAAVIVRAEECHRALYAGRTHHANPALRWHLEQRILPILALYQALRAELVDQDAALAEVEALCHAAFASRRRQVALLRLLPDPFPLFRWVGRRTMRRSYPPEGWTTEWLADDDSRLAFNIRSCLYLDTLRAYGAPELLPTICGFDDWMFEPLPPSIAWERTTTLGRGGDRCDFCWRRVDAVEVDRLASGRAAATRSSHR